MVVIYKDVKLRLNPKQWMDFTVPRGVTVVWDRYNFKEKTVVGRFTVSESHLNPNERKNEEFLEKMIENMGSYVVTENATNNALKDVPFGQSTVTFEGHPYLKDVPQSVDVHRSDKEKERRQLLSKEQLMEVNYSILHNAERFPELKQYRDNRLKPRELLTREGKEVYEVYTAVLEEIPS